MIARYEYKSPLGELVLCSVGDKLCLCDWKYRKMRQQIDQRIQKYYQSEFEDNLSDVIQKTIVQLEEYFNKNRTEFDIPLDLVGTDFQIKVWNELISIPYSNTLSYLQLSIKLGDPKAIRAVATAIGANGISIIVPCHRIIGSDGNLVGYAGGLNAKKKLLNLESKLIQNTLF